MIKLVVAVARKAGLSAEDFQSHWLGRHAPLVAARAPALGIRRYVQSHLIEHPANEAFRGVRGMLPPLDGLAELWWDSLPDMLAAFSTVEGAEAGRVIAEDEANFVDFAGSSAFLTQEHPIFDRMAGEGPGAEPVKIAFLLTRKDGMSRDECHATWLRDHGTLVTGFADLLRFGKYVQSHAIEPEWNEAFRGSRGFGPPLDGITEIWLNALTDLKRGVETEEGRAAAATLVEDERRFVQLDRSRCFLTREHLIFDAAG